MSSTDPREALLMASAIAADLIQAIDDKKVDLIAGKQLSEEDFTTVLFNKLNALSGNNTGNQTALTVPTSLIPGISGSNVQVVLGELKTMLDMVGTETGTSLLPPVADKTALKAIVGMVDKSLCLAETIGLYRFDINSAVAESGDNVIAPNSGSGRWIRVSKITVQAAIDITVSAIAGITSNNAQGVFDELKTLVDTAQTAANAARGDATNALTNAATAQATANAAKAVTDDLVNNLTLDALKAMMTAELTNQDLVDIVNNY